MSILTEIFAHKRSEVATAKQRVSEAELEKLAQATPVPPDFIRALTAPHPSISQSLRRSEDERRSGCSTPRLIAEVKHRSPSKGVLCQDFDPLRLANIYAENGAAAISVLTDEKYFGGRLSYLREIAEMFRAEIYGRDSREMNPPATEQRRINPAKIARFNGRRLVARRLHRRTDEGNRELHLVTAIPLLRKDFIFDHYQLLEARAAGASAALLIVAMLDQDNLQALISQAHALSLTPLVEVHTREELERALEAGAKIVGINNRDLHTFKVSLQTTLDLRPHIPAGVVVVAESGIKTMEDVRVLAEAGVDALLIGEGLVTAGDVEGKVREFAGVEGVIE